ncbi:MAG TPA: NAD-dependent epimerase/dehydratase family protein [Jatrophihabitantaceae bacterium]|nr:NAD-dependent epimerase/dehydratase family protein [Jatrophihabitantaceae bacterium]
MRLLVLGGTRFVGRAVVADALARGWDVTALHRGITGAPADGANQLLADRCDPLALAEALGGASWDAVVDTWSGAPAAARTAAQLLRGHARKYGYVSSCSVYEWGAHVDEKSPVVDGDPGAVTGDYAAIKRGAELAVLESFPDALLGRAGVILGPYEDVGRLPWWLDRIARGGRVVAPGRPARPLQYVDARDLAAWLLDGLADGLRGAVDVVGPSGHTTTQGLLEACRAATGSDAEFVWIDEGDLAAAGAQPWTQLPCWVPEAGEFAGFLEGDTSRAAATGLRCRPVQDTVLDTWLWLQRAGMPAQRPDRDPVGLPADLERTLLADARSA